MYVDCWVVITGGTIVNIEIMIIVLIFLDSSIILYSYEYQSMYQWCIGKLHDIHIKTITFINKSFGLTVKVKHKCRFKLKH